jgi:predicted ATPase
MAREGIFEALIYTSAFRWNLEISLANNAVAESPGLTALTLLDEPEVSLHPELLKLLADQLREASLRTQIIVATHSDTLIRFLDPAEVVVLDSTEDGMTTLTRADQLDLGDWLKDYSLDELWRNGHIGARA